MSSDHDQPEPFRHGTADNNRALGLSESQEYVDMLLREGRHEDLTRFATARIGDSTSNVDQLMGHSWLATVAAEQGRLDLQFHHCCRIEALSLKAGLMSMAASATASQVEYYLRADGYENARLTLDAAATYFTMFMKSEGVEREYANKEVPMGLILNAERLLFYHGLTSGRLDELKEHARSITEEPLSDKHRAQGLWMLGEVARREGEITTAITYSREAETVAVGAGDYVGATRYALTSLELLGEQSDDLETIDAFRRANCYLEIVVTDPEADPGVVGALAASLEQAQRPAKD